MKSDTHQNESLPIHYSIGLGELLSVVWRRKFCLAFCLFATIALGGVYYFNAERVYEVKCRLLVEKQELPIGDPSSNRPSRDLEFLGTQAEILGSSSIVSQVVDRLQWPVPAVEGVSPVTMLKERMTVRPVLGTNVLSISLQADDAARAVQAVDTLVDTYRQQMQREEQDVHVDVLETLARNEKEVRADLEKLEAEYRQLREESPLIATFKNSADIQLAHVDQLGRKLADTRGRRVELENQLRVASAEGFSARAIASDAAQQAFVPASLAVPAPNNAASNAKAANLPQPITQTFVGANLPGARDMVAIQNQLVQARVLAKELYSRFGHKHPEVRGVEEQIASLLAEEQKALQAGQNLLRHELETVIANEKQLSELCKSELTQSKLLDGYQLQEQQMTNQLARLQGVHDSIVTQLRQWKLTGQIVSDGRAPIRIAVLEAPVVPRVPVWPSPRILLGICAAVGLIAGFSLIAFLEQRTRNVRRQPPVADVLVTPLPKPVMPGV